MKRDDYVQVAMLIRLALNSPGNRVMPVNEVIDVFGDPSLRQHLNAEDVQRFIDFCERRQLATLFNTPHARQRIRFKEKDVQKHLTLMNNSADDVFRHVRELGWDWLIESIQNASDPASAPHTPDSSAQQRDLSSDIDVWEPLPIDRTNAEYEDAIRTSEAALKEIENNNGYAATEPEERTGIVETIRGTLKAIREGMPSRQTVVAGLLSPLKYIAKKFGDAGMGEIAKQAVVAIGKWLLGLP